MEIPFIGGAYKGRSTNLNAQECVNLYPVMDQEGGKSVAALMGTPGLIEFADSSYYKQVRGLHLMGGNAYAVIGNRVYGVSAAGSLTQLSGTINGFTGSVCMEDNGTELMIVVPGLRGYIYDKADASPAVTVISDADFPTPSSLTYQDGYFIVTETDTGKFYISGSYDGTSWDALDFATAEGSPDKAVSIIMDHRELWIFGKKSTEVFYNSGDADFPFERISGGFLEIGCGAAHSPAKLDNSIFWLTDKYQVVRAQGYQPQIISTRQIEYQISQYTVKSDAIGFGYTQEGHAFYFLTFPSADKTWCYDVATGFWHERTSYKGATWGRHRANCYAFFNGQHIIGDYQNGKLYKWDLDTYTDDGEPIKAIRVAQVIHKDRKNIFFNALEIEFEAGVGLTTGQGSDPQAMLDWSDDGGHTWSNEHWQGIGKKGEYSARAIWRRLGRSRGRSFRVTITDPVKRVIIAAHLEAEIGAA